MPTIWFSSHLFLTGRVGYYYGNQHTENVWGQPRFVFSRSNIGLLDVPAELQRIRGYATDTSTTEYVRNRNHRLSTQVDGTWYVNGWGTHALKAGIQMDWPGNDQFRGEKANNVGLQWNRPYGTKRGNYGYYTVSSNSREPRKGALWVGKADGSTSGLFVQDNWTIRHRLSLSLGSANGAGKAPRLQPRACRPPVVQFGFSDKIAPRVGASFDLFGDGKWKLHGSWGIFYDIFKYQLSVDVRWDRRHQSMPTRWTHTTGRICSTAPACPPACPGTLIGRTAITDTDMAYLDPDLKPIRLQEATAGCGAPVPAEPLDCGPVHP